MPWTNKTLNSIHCSIGNDAYDEREGECLNMSKKCIATPHRCSYGVLIYSLFIENACETRKRSKVWCLFICLASNMQKRVCMCTVSSCLVAISMPQYHNRRNRIQLSWNEMKLISVNSMANRVANMMKHQGNYWNTEQHKRQNASKSRIKSSQTWTENEKDMRSSMRKSNNKKWLTL